MATRRLPILAGLVFTLTLGGGALFLHQSDRPVPPAHAAPTPARAGIAVETAAAAQDRVVEDIRAFGTLVAHESVVVSTEIPGRVAKIGFREAQRVEAGDVLIELDADILAAELAKARSDLSLATANHERARTLAQQEIGRAHV